MPEYSFFVGDVLVSLVARTTVADTYVATDKAGRYLGAINKTPRFPRKGDRTRFIVVPPMGTPSGAKSSIVAAANELGGVLCS